MGRCRVAAAAGASMRPPARLHPQPRRGRGATGARTCANPPYVEGTSIASAGGMPGGIPEYATHEGMFRGGGVYGDVYYSHDSHAWVNFDAKTKMATIGITRCHPVPDASCELLDGADCTGVRHFTSRRVFLYDGLPDRPSAADKPGLVGTTLLPGDVYGKMVWSCCTQWCRDADALRSEPVQLVMPVKGTVVATHTFTLPNPLTDGETGRAMLYADAGWRNFPSPEQSLGWLLRVKDVEIPAGELDTEPPPHEPPLYWGGPPLDKESLPENLCSARKLFLEADEKTMRFALTHGGPLNSLIDEDCDCNFCNPCHSGWDF